MDMADRGWINVLPRFSVAKKQSNRNYSLLVLNMCYAKKKEKKKGGVKKKKENFVLILI